MFKRGDIVVWNGKLHRVIDPGNVWHFITGDDYLIRCEDNKGDMDSFWYETSFSLGIKLLK